jgi:hypothetical protein
VNLQNSGIDIKNDINHGITGFLSISIKLFCFNHHVFIPITASRSKFRLETFSFSKHPDPSPTTRSRLVIGPFHKRTLHSTGQIPPRSRRRRGRRPAQDAAPPLPSPPNAFEYNINQTLPAGKTSMNFDVPYPSPPSSSTSSTDTIS